MPVTIGTSTTARATAKMPLRKVYKIGSYFFAFYSNGTNLVYQTSTDGVTWGAATTVRACAHGDYVDVQHFPAYSTAYIYYVYGVDANNYPLIFRRGSVSGNSITWEAEVTIVGASLVLHFAFPSIAIGTDGKLYVGCCRGTSTNHRLVLFSNPNNDGSGTWTLDTAFSSTVNLDPGTHTLSRFLGLTATKVTAFYRSDTMANYAYRRRFDGTSWLSEELIDGPSYIFFSAVANGDNVGFAYVKTVTMYPYFRLCTWDTVGDEEQISTTLTPDSVNVAVDETTGYYYAFWRNSIGGSNSIIYYCQRTTSWQTTQTFVSGEAYIKDVTIIPTPWVTNSLIGVTWTAQELSPYNQRFGVLNVAPPIVPIQYSDGLVSVLISS